MESSSFYSVMFLFRVVCIVSTLIVTGYYIHLYCLNKDLCLVDFKHYQETDEDHFPTLSVCFKNYFNSTYLLDHGIKEENYLAFLKGQHYDSKMLELDFNKSTLNISKYISDDYVHWQNGSSKRSSVEDRTTFPNTYNGFWRDNFYKCYGINVPFQGDILFVSTLIDGKIFRKSSTSYIRPDEGDYLITIFHYPNQLIIFIK